MRVLCCGSRDYQDAVTVERFIMSMPYDAVIIQGGASGADFLCENAAKLHDLEVVRFDADWRTHGKAAGPIRNQQMIDEGKPDLVVAFYNGTHPTPGTRDMMMRADKARIPVVRAINEL